MFYDLNVPWTANQSPAELQRTISFLSELGYDTIALNHTISSSLPSQFVNPIPTTFSFPLPPKTVILRRCTIEISDPSQNHRLPDLAGRYDILALRPISEKGFLAACGSINEHSIISLDLTIRHQFLFKPKTLMTAVKRGIFFEISYGQATLSDANAKRNFISNTMGIIRATKGRGLVISSEARNVLGIRAPADVVNLMNVWGLGSERGKEAVGVNPRGVIVNEELKRSAYMGVIGVIDGGQSLVEKDKGQEGAKDATNGVGKKGNKGKRKAEDTIGGAEKESTPQPKKQAIEGETPPLSKRQAKKARLQALKFLKEASKGTSSSQANTPIKTNTNTPQNSDTPIRTIANG